MARILVVEDNFDSRELMVFLLLQSGHMAEYIENAEAALDRIRDNPPDLVLCDILLPKMTGLELVQRLRSDEDFQKLPIVAVSAGVTHRTREETIKVGFNGFIEKPINPRVFVSQIEAFLPESVSQQFRH